MTFAQPFQDYEILDRVGAGAMGTVFKARHKKLSRIVALKVLKPSLARDSRYVERLKREARIVASLNHPHIVTGYDLGEEGGYHFFVMEFVEGKSLRALLAEWGMFVEDYVLDIGIQIAEALDHAYQCSVIHRDIKPGNVLIDEDGDVKLTDMGLAKGPADLTLTRDGATVGTPQYISPEQARNPQDVDVRSDLYSLGATLYHMATGVPPFMGDTMAELISKVIYDPPVPPIEVNPALSEGLSLVLRKLLAKDLRVRYQDPRELLDDLERIKQSQPVQVDAARLAAGEGEGRSRLPLRFLLTALVLAAIGGAIWVGMQLRADNVTAEVSDPYLHDVDRELATISTPGGRWLHLRALMQTVPPGMERALMRRENRAIRDLQSAVDGACAAFTGEGWTEFAAWTRSPSEWPDRERCERERVLPTLNAATGMLPGQLPSTLNTARLDELRGAIDRELAARDVALLRQLDEFLTTTLADRVDERLLACDYAGAGRLWREALASFCDGVRRPAVEQLAEATMRQARDRCDQGRQMARPVIDAAEALVADAMRDEVVTVCRHYEEQLDNGQEPAAIAAAVAGFRDELLQVWPASSRFRPDRDPWREIEGRLGELQQRTAMVVAANATRRFDSRCDFAWRALCHGEVDDALAVLEDIVPPSEELRAELIEHRRALRAAARVHDRVLAALAEVDRPVLAFPRTGGGLAVRLRVEYEGGRPVLICESGDRTRRAALTEFRFSELLASLRKAGGDPLAGLAAEEVARGRAVLRLIGDDLAGFGVIVRSLDDMFLVDEVAPRIQRVRDERDETVLDRTDLLARMQAALSRSREGAPVHELETAILSFESRVAERDRSWRERSELRAAKLWRKLVVRRQAVREDVALGAPQGAFVDVEIDEESHEIVATMTVLAPQLLRGAAEGWQLQGDMLEFAGGDRPWSELQLQKLSCESGIPTAGPGRTTTTLQLDLVVPPSTAGRRFYVIEFRGIAVMLVITANDGVQAALVEGDPRREARADRAFDRAMRGVLEQPKALVVPGAVHRLTFEILASSGRTRAAVKVSFDGRELIDGQHPLDAQKPVALVIYPRQEMRVKQVVVSGRGL